MADYILRPLEPRERNAFGTLFAELGEAQGANFNLDYAAYNTQEIGSNKRFFHILNDTPGNSTFPTERLMSCLAVTDMGKSMVFGLYSIINASGEIACFELRDIHNKVVYTSTTNNPLVPREPVEGENPAIISSPSISNLSHNGGGKFSGQFDVSVLIFFSWDIGDPWEINLW